jgi:Glu-tRNA(Gln) amidotransferase subunit E-like FAD-binding protein
VAQRLADLIRRVRRLASERDRLVDSLAEEWVRALRDHGLSRADLDELWAALTEEALRRAGNALDHKWTSPVVRQETEEVIARLRARVEAALGDDAAAR